MLRLASGALLTMLSLACVGPVPAGAPPATLQTASTTAPAVARFVVHVDSLDPGKVGQFEEARMRFVKELAARNLSDHRGLYLRIGASTYWSVAPFGSWAELDALGDRRRAAQKEMKGLVEEYDKVSDESLVFPHKNEIWTERVDLAYSPTQRGLHHAVRVDIEDVRPMADYASAWRPIVEALEKARYPLARRSFFSSYGTGRLLSFWLANAGDAAEVMPLDRALALAVGDARARELLAGLRACVLATETHGVKAPLDMASPRPTEP